MEEGSMDNGTNAPRTAGELRRRLAGLGDPWTVDPRLADDDPLPDRPRGGMPEEHIPEAARLVALSPETDLLDLLSAQPPANPDLRARWTELGLLPADEGSQS
jgi:hypothetical protein